jgi:hypothetical protein
LISENSLTDLTRVSTRYLLLNKQNEIVPEPWIIEANQLKFDKETKRLGEVSFNHIFFNVLI